MTQKSMSFDDFANVTIGRSDYRTPFRFIEAVSRMTYSDLSEKSSV